MRPMPMLWSVDHAHTDWQAESVMMYLTGWMNLLYPSVTGKGYLDKVMN